MASRNVLKVSALHYKDPNKTDEEFEKWFHEDLNPKWVKLIKKHEVLKYAVVSVAYPFIGRLLKNLLPF
ncbi:unnamed protein product [Clonostachys solani]|uniref:Uncharacterized protein n=1 Tax=Clonostachys solani TaxID=160281 RepID=A0A9N9Z725_9HYPO|nr:unnamed protein product [Clonostachys solani]